MRAVFRRRPDETLRRFGRYLGCCAARSVAANPARTPATPITIQDVSAVACSAENLAHGLRLGYLMESHVNAAGATAPGFSGRVARLGAQLRVESLWSVERIPAVMTAVFFVALFWRRRSISLTIGGRFPRRDMVCSWRPWRSGSRGRGAFARTRGLVSVVGLTMIVLAVAIRCAAGLAAELFTMRGSMVHGARRTHRLPLRLPAAHSLVAARSRSRVCRFRCRSS